MESTDGITPSRLAEAHAAGYEGNRPPYVPRDVDSRLDAALEANGLIILAGASKAGKSRTAFEALLRTRPSSEIMILAAPSALREVLELDPQLSIVTQTGVLWLDNLEDYLDADPLASNLLESVLTRRPELLVVCTIRSNSIARLERSELGVGQATRDLLELGQQIELKTTPDSWD